jgi:alcohol dehydrogenase class IV
MTHAGSVTSESNETVFTYGSPQLKFGWGAADEVGYDVQQLGGRRVLVVTDAGVAATGGPQRVADSVTASSGSDVLCHALESYTARPYTAYPRKRPEQRVPYCGANPVSDTWAEQALTLMSRSFVTAVQKPDDHDARADMALAATLAGMGFGNAGVHVPHANGYPIAGLVRDFRPPGYPPDEPMVPHGMSVSLTAPEAFRFTHSVNPDRHQRAASLLSDGRSDDLPTVLRQVMNDVGMPPGIGAVGYTEADVPDLVAGAFKQQRLLAMCPRDVTEDDLAGIFTRSI